MSLETRKMVAQTIVRSLRDGTFGEVEFSPDFWCWTLTSGRLSRQQFLDRVELFGAIFTAPAMITVDMVTGEADRVVVQFRVSGELITGRHYRQNAAFMVEFDDRDRVRHWREYFDSRLVAELLFPAMRELQARRSAE